VFYDPRGIPAPERPPAIEAGAGGAEALVRANRGRGIDPGWATASCRWARVEDIPLDVVERADEAA
jgi:hypothetical protein